MHSVSVVCPGGGACARVYPCAVARRFAPFIFAADLHYGEGFESRPTPWSSSGGPRAVAYACCAAPSSPVFSGWGQRPACAVGPGSAAVRSACSTCVLTAMAPLLRTAERDEAWHDSGRVDGAGAGWPCLGRYVNAPRNGGKIAHTPELTGFLLLLAALPCHAASVRADVLAMWRPNPARAGHRPWWAARTRRERSPA